MEQTAATRVRRGGRQEERTTGEIVAAVFRHDTSRALDPQLHTHFVVFNATWDQSEQRWKALQTEQMFEQMTFFTEVYRTELAHRLQGLGYRLRPAEHGFEIAGVSADIIARFSKRRQAVLEAEAKLLDDRQAVSHQAMQLAAGQHSAARLLAGLKLNPEDRWTRLQFVRGMAKAGEPAVAAEELRRVRSSGAASWDVHEAAAELEMAGERWTSALAELQLALPLSPSNALLHAQLAGVYHQLNEVEKWKEHTEAALRFDRGEISAKIRLSSQTQLAVASAFSQGKSGERGSLDELTRRAEGGDLAAQLALTKVCFDDQPPRAEEGMRWLLKAAEQGNDHAQLNYAWNLLGWRGKDAGEEVVQWLTRSAGQGNIEAQYRLGLLLYEGKLVKGDNLAAGQWILLAAGKGSVEAKSMLKEMELFLSADELAEARKRAAIFAPATSKAGAPKSNAH